MFCNKCGVAVENNIRRCPQCGHLLKINKNELSFEELNDRGFHGEFNSKYEIDEYASLSAIENGERYKNSYDINKDSSTLKVEENFKRNDYKTTTQTSYGSYKSNYQQELEAYRKSKQDIPEPSKSKINVGIVILLFFINPFLLVIYIFIMSLSNKNNGKK